MAQEFRLDHAAIFAPADRFQSVVHFYEELLDWRVVRSGRSPVEYVYLSDGRSYLEVVAIANDDGDVGKLGFNHLAFRLDGATLDECAERASHALTPDQVLEIPGGSSFFISDPIGGSVQIISRAGAIDETFEAAPTATQPERSKPEPPSD